MFTEHVDICNDDKNAGDTMKRAIAVAHDFVYKENNIQVYGRMDPNPKLALARFNEEADCRKVNIGWTKRPKMRGENA